MKLVDAVGRRHTPAGAGARIVSLVPSITELVCDLGLAERLVGRTGFCIHPRERVRRVAKVGGTKDDDPRRLPDTPPAAGEGTARFGPRVIVAHPLGPLDNLALYRLIGGVFGREAEAEGLCERFERAYAACEREAAGFPSQRVIYLIWRKPWMTVSRDTYISRTLANVNWHTVPETAADRYPEIAFDEAMLAGVDVVLASSEPFPFRARDVDALRALPELRGRAIALVDGEMTSWYGSRAIAGLEYLPQFRRALE